MPSVQDWGACTPAFMAASRMVSSGATLSTLPDRLSSISNASLGNGSLRDHGHRDEPDLVVGRMHHSSWQCAY